MPLGRLLCMLLLALLMVQTRAVLNYPNALDSRLEHLLVDTEGAFRAGFKDAITPCSNYVNGPQTLGRQTSAQWLRVAFHDFVTAHVADGRGGLDASIGFETLREENVGSAFNDSFSFFVPFADSRTSMADLLALSVVTSLTNCGGLQVPLRGGRIDATGPGPSGVPEPQTSLEETLAEFFNAGFDRSEAIGLTACGHSLGHVHHSNFPDVVPASAVTPNNTGGGVSLDTTPTNFDISVVQEYLQGYGQRGGPFVTTTNITTKSDLRLYESDSNATMRMLGQSIPYFFSTCNELFEKMINTVPKEVQLGDVIRPLPVKPVNVTFDIDKDTNLKISGYIRVLSAPSVPALSEIKITVQSEISVTALPDRGYNIFGNTSWYPFSSTLSSTGQLPKILKIATGSGNSVNFALRPEVFFVPSLSGSGTGRDPTHFTITAAVLSKVGKSSNISAAVAFPTAQSGTLAPRIETIFVPLVMGNMIMTVPGFDGLDYHLYSGDVALDPDLVDMVSVDILVGKGLVDEYNHFL